MKRTIYAFWLPCLFFFIFSGCVRQHEAVSGEIKAFRSGDLHLTAKKDIPKIIYVDLRDANGVPAHLPQDVENALAGKSFELTDSPSKAGYILHINIVRKGSVDPATMPALVESGYGTDAKFSGHGATAILADALLVQRSVPQAKRPSRERLKNITKRNARGSSQMRFGLMIPGEISSRQDATAFFSRELAKELQNALAPQSQASAEED